MAIMRCARLQKELGCGTRRTLQTLRTSNPERIVFSWPWLRRRDECPERATEKQVREILLAITPLKLAERIRKIRVLTGAPAAEDARHSAPVGAGNVGLCQ